MKRIFTSFVIIIALLGLKSNAQIITTIAGTGTQGYNGDNIAATSAEISQPYGICMDRHGNIYIADAVNFRIRKIDASTGIIITVAGNGTSGYNGDSIMATSAELTWPYNVAVDTADNIYIVDQNRVRKVTASTGLITTIAGSGVGGYNGDNIPAVNAQINFAQGVTVDSACNVYIADELNGRIRKISASTGIITTIAGNGTGIYNGENITALSAGIEPTFIAFDATGNIYFADGNSRVRKLNLITGLINTIAGNGTIGYNGDNILATNAELSYPSAIVIDLSNNIFIADFYPRVRRVSAISGIITTYAGTGVGGYNGDNILALNAELDSAYSLALDTAGNLFIGDWGAHRIRKVTNYTGINDITFINNTIAVFPNPASIVLNIRQTQSSQTTNQLIITDLLGNVVLKQAINNSTESTIDIASLSAGIYFYEVRASGPELQNPTNIARGKFVKE